MAVIYRIIPPLNDKQLELFLMRVNNTHTARGCLEWNGAISGDNYGIFKLNKHSFRAHRVSYFIHHGAMDHSLCVLHSCDNTRCVNPAHLFLGTHQDNVADRTAKGRTASGERHGSYLHPERLPHGDQHWTSLRPESRTRGERVGGAKLSADKVIEIRRLRVTTTLTLKEIGKMFGVSGDSISLIVARKIWRHVT